MGWVILCLRNEVKIKYKEPTMLKRIGIEKIRLNIIPKLQGKINNSVKIFIIECTSSNNRVFEFFFDIFLFLSSSYINILSRSIKEVRASFPSI